MHPDNHPTGAVSQDTGIFRQAVYRRSDRLMNYFLPGFFLLGLVFAPFYDTWLIAWGVGGLSLLAYYGTKLLQPASTLYQYVLSAILGVFMAQYIYQMHGMFEMHFFAFIGSAILITYQNWKVQIPMMIVVTVHHGLFAWLQYIGYDKIYFTQLNSWELRTFVIHIFLSAVIFFTCGLWSYLLNKYSEIQIGQAINLGKLQQEATLATEERKKEQERQAEALDRAVAQGKFEMAADVLHDIGNAMVGFGSQVMRTQRMRENGQTDKLQKLCAFFRTEKPAMITAVGEARADAIVALLEGVSRVHQDNEEELSRSVDEQLRITRHIQGILDIQRQYINGRATQERRPVNIRIILQDCLSMQEAPMEKRGIGVFKEIPAEVPIIKGDHTKLMQVILHLLKNHIEALKAVAVGKLISIRLILEKGLLTLQLRDNGRGFDEETLNRLFDREQGTGGAGLGWSSCRSIIESHSGTLAVSSEGPGKGSVTTITFKL